MSARSRSRSRSKVQRPRTGADSSDGPEYADVTGRKPRVFVNVAKVAGWAGTRNRNAERRSSTGSRRAPLDLIMPLLADVPTGRQKQGQGQGEEREKLAGQKGDPRRSVQSKGWGSHSGVTSAGPGLVPRSGGSLAEGLQMTLQWRSSAKKAAKRAKEQAGHDARAGRTWVAADWSVWVFTTLVVYVGVLFSYEFRVASSSREDLL